MEKKTKATLERQELQSQIAILQQQVEKLKYTIEMQEKIIYHTNTGYDYLKEKLQIYEVMYKHRFN